MSEVRSRRRWALAAVWVGGTALAMTASIVAIDVAGTRVTTPASFSAARIGQAADVSSGRAADQGGDAGRSVPGAADGDRGGAAGAATTAAAGGGATTATTSTHAGGDSGGAAVPGAASSSGGGSEPSGPGVAESPDTTASPPGTTAPPTTGAPPPSSVRSTSMAGGTVRVQCIASSITLLAATPTAGYVADTSKVAATIQVEFQSGKLSDQITASCAAGVITFQTEHSSDG